jgi:hypothetical protein
VNLSGKPNGWKELDLLQEHHNFWLKVWYICIRSFNYLLMTSQIIYLARGANRSWEWMSVVSVCIFALRDVIRQVQTNFKTPHNGKTHTSPSRATDIKKICDYLQQHRLQEYVADRAGKEYATPVSDLLAEGAAHYASNAGAFKNFRNTIPRATYTGTSTCSTSDDSRSSSTEGEDTGHGVGCDSQMDDIGFEDLSRDEDEYPEGSDPEEIRSIIEGVITSFPEPGSTNE